MGTGLVRIAEIAKERPKERFTALVHHINAGTLMECHEELRGAKASGVDKVTWEKYECFGVQCNQTHMRRIWKPIFKISWSE